jgi:hypothetical protein
MFPRYPTLALAGELAGALPDRERLDLVVTPSVSNSLLLFATAVSTYKPLGPGTPNQPLIDTLRPSMSAYGDQVGPSAHCSIT